VGSGSEGKFFPHFKEEDEDEEELPLTLNLLRKREAVTSV